MTEFEQFEAVLGELAELLLDLGDLASQVVLIGGQVLALESRLQGGTGTITLKTRTGIEVDRGFSFEPDLLFELEGDEFAAERLPEVLRGRGYQQVREFRWSKPLAGGAQMALDLFSMPGVEREALPVPMTVLPDARLALKFKHRIEFMVGAVPLRLSVPDAAGFLAMKVRAKLEQRPRETKDCFDLFAYTMLMGTKTVLSSLAQAGQEGRLIQAKLVDLFREPSAPGVRDVLDYASSLEPAEQELLAQAVVDLFSEF
ncbi:hypothetical protein [Stigmatella erecta]|uniref:Nucleotidyl transferase AbiEii toxin, Type IV TA system n=1 Tax=Stigmatella erecta TaxID=83460 RepID=A0A1I0KDL3_9BACT|nr:hypothetical protein [Stigmatella erecta]SEU21532.1 hypothetical protein SAMN05443639_11015 [Stigmatella erecta]